MFSITSHVSKDINSYDNKIGKIIDKRISNNSSNVSGKLNLNSKILILKLSGTDEIFGIYNKEQNYELLNKKLSVNDSIKIYYNNKKTKNVNLDVFQIIKNNEVVYDSSEYIKKERLGAYIALIGGFVLLILTIRQFKKDYKKH